ncbi:MAG: hypothetical protein B6245_01680 [Desulfobacteraceae bacterium 4572_88]|nr:MAG: hypothetical protein B6245_01680 [Desulfobacteraceae bacterium 4572_88]RLC16306.1 MAG: hypothetical protein DRI57_11435 [Deltaproteobacteria bacterium]
MFVRGHLVSGRYFVTFEDHGADNFCPSHFFLKNKMSVTFLRFFNRGGREEGTENTETCQNILCDL